MHRRTKDNGTSIGFVGIGEVNFDGGLDDISEDFVSIVVGHFLGVVSHRFADRQKVCFCAAV